MKHIVPLITIFCIFASCTVSAQIGFLKKAKENSQQLIAGAIDGLFVLIAEQEKDIRKDPYARTSDILKKVFGEN